MSIPDQETLQIRLGQALRRLREGRSLTEVEVARRMGLEPSDAFRISSWERGESEPLAHQLWAYLIAIGALFGDLDLELNPLPSNPRLREIARELDSLGRSSGS